MSGDLRTTAASVVSWFLLNIAIGNLNGWILKHHGFSYPVVLTAVHMLCCWLLSAVCLVTILPPADPRPTPVGTVAKVRTLALAFCASVALGNIALRYIYVSFAQMVSAASPFFTMLLMGAMVGKRYSLAQYSAIVPMCGGVMMCTVGEINFHMLGFTAVVASTLLRGVKSILQGRLLTAPEERLDAMLLLYHMSRESLLPLGLYSSLVEYQAYYDPQLSGPGAPRLWGLVLLSGLVSFFLNLANFLVTKHTSAVMLQVLGNVKAARPPRPLSPAPCLSPPLQRLFTRAAVDTGRPLDPRLPPHLRQPRLRVERRRLRRNAGRRRRLQLLQIDGGGSDRRRVVLIRCRVKLSKTTAPAPRCGAAGTRATCDVATSLRARRAARPPVLAVKRYIQYR